MSILSEHRLLKWHRQSYDNMELLSKVDFAGCFFCLEPAFFAKITETRDDGKTAVCPTCGVDALIPNPGIHYLGQMKNRWFGRVTNNKAEVVYE